MIYNKTITKQEKQKNKKTKGLRFRKLSEQLQQQP